MYLLWQSRTDTFSPIRNTHTNKHSRRGYWNSHWNLCLLFLLQTGKKKGGSFGAEAGHLVPQVCLNHDLFGKLHHQIPSAPALPARAVPSAPCGSHCLDPVFHPNKGKRNQGIGGWVMHALVLRNCLRKFGGQIICL